MQVTVPLYDKVTSFDSMVVLDDGGLAMSKETLHNIGGRRGKALFKTYIPIPASVSLLLCTFSLYKHFNIK